MKKKLYLLSLFGLCLSVTGCMSKGVVFKEKDEVGVLECTSKNYTEVLENTDLYKISNPYKEDVNIWYIYDSKLFDEVQPLKVKIEIGDDSYIKAYQIKIVDE